MGVRDDTIAKLDLSFALTDEQKSALLQANDVGLLHILAMSALKTAVDDIVTALGGGEAVRGPASAVDGNVVFFDGITGKLVKDIGITLSGSNTGDQDLSGYALISSLGTAAAEDVGYFATAAQGALADTALQPADIGVSVQAYDADLTTWAGITPGTNVGAALAIAVGNAGAFVTFNGALGTPTSGTVTNLTGTASININGTVGATTPNTGAFTTVTASGNATLSGTDNTAPNQTVTGDDSLMTRSLSRSDACSKDWLPLREEFAGGGATDQQFGELGWRSYVTGSATFAFQVSETNHPGILRITTGATSGNGGLIALAPSGNPVFPHLTSDECSFVFVFRLNTTTSVKFRIGVGNVTTAAPTRYFGVRFDTALGDTNFMLVAYNADGTESDVSDTGVAANTSWHSVKIDRTGVSALDFSFDDAAAASLSSEVPSFLILKPFFHIVTDTTAAASADFDFFSVQAKLTR